MLVYPNQSNEHLALISKLENILIQRLKYYHRRAMLLTFCYYPISILITLLTFAVTVATYIATVTSSSLREINIAIGLTGLVIIWLHTCLNFLKLDSRRQNQLLLEEITKKFYEKFIINRESGLFYTLNSEQLAKLFDSYLDRIARYQYSNNSLNLKSSSLPLPATAQGPELIISDYRADEKSQLQLNRFLEQLNVKLKIYKWSSYYYNILFYSLIALTGFAALTISILGFLIGAEVWNDEKSKTVNIIIGLISIFVAALHNLINSLELDNKRQSFKLLHQTTRSIIDRVSISLLVFKDPQIIKSKLKAYRGKLDMLQQYRPPIFITRGRRSGDTPLPF